MVTKGLEVPLRAGQGLETAKPGGLRVIAAIFVGTEMAERQ
jgi:hypothetical protein